MHFSWFLYYCTVFLGLSEVSYVNEIVEHEAFEGVQKRFMSEISENTKIRIRELLPGLKVESRKWIFFFFELISVQAVSYLGRVCASVLASSDQGDSILSNFVNILHVLCVTNNMHIPFSK